MALRYLVLLFFVATTTVTPWYQHYEKGLRALDEGRAQEALEELNAALAQRPESGLRLRTDGPRYVDYFPHLYLAAAAYMAGDLELARQHLARAEAAGVAAQTEEGRSMLEAHRVLLKAEPAPASSPPRAGVGKPGYADYERKPVVLSEEEYEEVQRRVLTRCGLDSGSAARQAPWYYFYELGLELARSEDPQRAVDAVIKAAELQPRARHSARMYGMWFIDYLPYFEIAKLHVKLGNRDCAADALRISREQGELTPDDKRFDELLALEEEVDFLP